MSQSIIAIYENGVLRPLLPMPFPEHSRLRIQVQQVLPKTTEHRQQVQAALTTAGLSQPASNAPSSTRLSPERRAALAQIFAAGQPLSEVILQEREGR